MCAELGVVPLWQSATDASRRSLIVRLSDHLELCHRSPRMRAARAILYIAQVSVIFFLNVTLILLFFFLEWHRTFFFYQYFGPGDKTIKLSTRKNENNNYLIIILNLF